MRFASLGSGSRGNATLLEAEDTAVLVDCGFGLKDTERRLQRLGRTAAELSAIVVTHEHSDHIKGVSALARRHGLPVYATHGTARSRHLQDCGELRELRAGLQLRIGVFELEPVAVPHDAAEPVQFVFGYNGQRLGILTDCGSVTPHMLERYAACDGLMLECNHDREMLRDGPYAWPLKQRVGGDYGHLSNGQAADFLARLDQSRLRELVVSHVSHQNNEPARAELALGAVKAEGVRLRMAEQELGVDWCELA